MSKETKAPKYTKNKDKLNTSLSNETKEKAKKRENKIVERVESTEKFLISSLTIIFGLLILVAIVVLTSTNTHIIKTPQYVFLIGDQEIKMDDLKDVLNRNSGMDQDSLLSSFINDSVLLKEAQDNNFTTTDDEVDQYIEALASQSGGTVNDLKVALESINNSFDSFKTYVKNAIIISKFIEENIRPFVKVTEDEAKEFYENNQYMFEEPKKFNVSHILVSDKELANTILEEAKETKDFEELVQKYKNDSIEATNFEFYEGSVVEPFQKAVDSVNESGIYDGIVESNYTAFSGYHIVYVYEKFPEQTIEFDEIKQSIIEYIQTEKSDLALSDYLEVLIQNTKIWFNYQLLEKENISYSNIETLYELSNKKICMNEQSDIIYFSDKKLYDDSVTFYDISNPGIVEIFKDCFKEKIQDISNVKLPVMVCLKNDVLIEGGNLKQISSLCK
ncbi:MAG: peptidyl-prolyl cis-trans isomerase [Candidatus Nanoarchaeia archaeon]|nr:peptidyl-prolyl cis-trans isomerase [Candidatus Nanoarchaeia archaeon]